MIRRFAPLAIVLTLTGACAGTSGSMLAPTSNGAYTQTDLTLGAGALASTGSRVTVAYTGWLYDTGQPSGKGKQFDTNTSFTFTIGTGQVIKGWEQGVAGMRVGGQRRLIIPPDLAYGNQVVNNTIPANATLVFDITLISIG